MDIDKQRLTDAEIKILTKNIYTIPDDGDVLSPVWLRCIIRDNHALDKFLLDYRRNFLPYFGFILWVIFIISKIN